MSTEFKIEAEENPAAQMRSKESIIAKLVDVNARIEVLAEALKNKTLFEPHFAEETPSQIELRMRVEQDLQYEIKYTLDWVLGVGDWPDSEEDAILGTVIAGGYRN